MAKFINNKEDIIEEMIKGIVYTNPKLKYLEDERVIIRKQLDPTKVALISGGGSGHEPAHAGFVGRGMLDAAVVGDIFTSPTPDKVLAAIKAADTGNGVLLIIKNYTGDVMNFEMAMELAEMSGIKCAKIIVNDDVAVEDSTYTAGRRGIAGTILIHKILGAMAQDGASLEQLTEYGQDLVARVKSMGISASSCRNPQATENMFEMNDDEMEMGMGIHGEPGIKREKLLPVNEIVTHLLNQITSECSNQEKYLVLINGLNSTPLMELYIICNDVRNYLQNHNYDYVDIKVGNFMTSLNMDGFSITLCAVTEDDINYYNRQVEVLGW